MIKAKCKHLPTITSYVSPLKNCRTVVRQFLYMVCCAHHHNIIKKPKADKSTLDFLVRCRSRHSVSKGPPDLSPKFFRFAQNLDTRVRVPTTRNNKNSEADKYLLRYFGTLEGTRTPDLLVRSQSLYPAELPAHICVALFVLQ